MFESFLQDVRNQGKVRVISSQESHNVKHLEVGAVITRDDQIGIMFQDKSSGKNWMIEIGSDPEEFQQAIVKISDAFLAANNLKGKFDEMLRNKSR